MGLIHSKMMEEKIRKKLFSLATRKRKIHERSGVLVPQSLAPIPREALFRTDKPRRRVLELGSGWGEFLCNWLERHTEDDYVSFEIKAQRIKTSLKSLERLDTKPHLRLIPINFNWFLEELLPRQSFDVVIINFPDPWPKRRHWKHRLIQMAFIEKLSRVMQIRAKVYIATDHAPYARQILRIFRRAMHFESVYAWPHYVRKHDEDMPYTRFERLHLSENRVPYYFCWRYTGSR